MLHFDFNMSQAWVDLAGKYNVYGTPSPEALKAEVMAVLFDSRVSLVEFYMMKALKLSFRDNDEAVGVVNTQIKSFPKAGVTPAVHLQPQLWHSCQLITSGRAILVTVAS